jgi:hypothetical protein
LVSQVVLPRTQCHEQRREVLGLWMGSFDHAGASSTPRLGAAPADCG